MTTAPQPGPSPNRLSHPRAKVEGMKATLIRPRGVLPGSHPDHPFADCARCYGETYGAALTAVVEARRQCGLSLPHAVVHEETAALLVRGNIDPVLCPTHKRAPKPRWTRTQIEYARWAEAQSGRRVVGVVIDDEGNPIGHAHDGESCTSHARDGRRVIVVRDCPIENRPVEGIQRSCDTRYRLAVPR